MNNIVLKRVMAGIVDYTALFLCSFFIYYVDRKSNHTPGKTFEYGVILLFLLIDSSPLFPGKKLMGLKLVNHQGRPPFFGLKVLRGILSAPLFVIDFFIFPLSVLVLKKPARIVDFLLGLNLVPVNEEGAGEINMPALPLRLTYLWCVGMGLGSIQFFYEKDLVTGGLFLLFPSLILLMVVGLRAKK